MKKKSISPKNSEKKKPQENTILKGGGGGQNNQNVYNNCQNPSKITDIVNLILMVVTCKLSFEEVNQAI